MIAAVILPLAIAVLMIVSMWKVYTKAGAARLGLYYSDLQFHRSMQNSR